MKPIPLNAETRALAKRLVWFESPAEALADPIRFIAYAFARAAHDDMRLAARLCRRRGSQGGARQGSPRHYRPALVVLLEFAHGSVSGAATA
jgi:hypothetical protein